MDLKKSLFGVITALLYKSGRDLLAVVAPEIYAAFAEWADEKKTPDGWAEPEYLLWLNGAIGRVRKQEIGSKWVDFVGDWALQALQMKINKRLDEIEGEKPPVVIDPPPVPKPYYGQLFESKPDPAVYNVDGDKLWSNNAANPLALRWTITDVRATVSYPGWVGVSW